MISLYKKIWIKFGKVDFLDFSYIIYIYEKSKNPEKQFF